ncbi:hypothetical protein ANN_04288 [Periplaneta americana]|uniref:Uncharacterized protein n=1 Tax=Periplaneta americana TaxID=6978 RepID=A0ABQ8T9Q3_PERAM|nr:hypothetical protein ANN_04288 [Periplaneta americana]
MVGLCEGGNEPSGSLKAISMADQERFVSLHRMKKRSLKPHSWKKNVRKLQKNSGMAYTSQKNKLVSSPKQSREDVAMSKFPMSEMQVVSFALQQQMYLRYLTHLEMYYNRQLAFVNLGIHFEEEEKGIMFFWDETAVDEEQLKSHFVCIYFWQKKNRGMLAMMLTLLPKGYFTEITHKFPVRGHTFLSCDRDFSLTEKSKRGKEMLFVFRLDQACRTVALESDCFPPLFYPTHLFYLCGHGILVMLGCTNIHSWGGSRSSPIEVE